jgi:hypothetical protein
MKRGASKIKVEIDYTRQDMDFCCWLGCDSRGEYPAPKFTALARSLENSDSHKGKSRLYFCLEHVRSYNLAWDFFRGMSEEEIANFQKEAVTGHRPTRKIRSYSNRLEQALSSHPLLDFKGFFSVEKRNDFNLPPKEKKSLAVLDLEYPVTLKEIKDKYKSLVKRHHPDINGGDKKSEEIFKAVSEAYAALKNSDYFA